MTLPIPALPLLGLSALWLGLAMALPFWSGLAPAWQIGGGLLATLALADWLAGRSLRGQLRAEREIPQTLPVGSWQTVHLRLHGATSVRGELRDRHPEAFAHSGLPLSFAVPAGGWVRPGYRVQVTQRGPCRFAAIDLRLASPLGLWRIPETLPVASEVRVYPDFARISQYALLATDNRLAQLGILQRRRRGEGMEFHQLRDYRQEDSPRQIDWKASSRMGRLISREYQDERDQQIVFLLDCGSRMRARDGDLSHFDHTLNALLLLSWVALGQGDAVGLSTFGHATPRFLPPKKSVATVNRLLNAVYDLEASTQLPDYLSAAEQLLGRLTKRSLVVLVTNVRDEDDDTLVPAMALLGRRHLVTLVSLREAVLDDVVAAPVEDFQAALTRAAGLEYLHARRRQSARLRHAGALLVEATPNALPVALVNHYWSLKRAGRI